MDGFNFYGGAFFFFFFFFYGLYCHVVEFAAGKFNGSPIFQALGPIYENS
jgi:hypothetical protein